MEQAVATTKIPLMHFIAYWEVERSWRMLQSRLLKEVFDAPQ